MTSFDYFVLLIIFISAGLGLLRGLVKELLSLCAYLAAFLGALWWGPRFAGLLSNWLENPLLQTVFAYLGVFIAVLLLVGLINLTLAALISKTGLSPADHGLGALFGFLRGLLIIFALITVAGYTELPQEPWWQQARLSGAAVKAVQSIKAWLPPNLASWLPY